MKLSHKYIKVISEYVYVKEKTYFYHSKSKGLHSRNNVFLYPNITKASKKYNPSSLDIKDT